MMGKDASERPEPRVTDEANGDIVVVEYDQTDVTSPSTAVLKGFEQIEEVDLTEIGPLQNVIDLDALDDLFRSGQTDKPGGSTQVKFELEDIVVNINSGGRVVVRPPE